MKKIACFINDNSFLECVSNFCATERFTLVNFLEEKCDLDLSVIVFITDCANTVKNFKSDTPLCYIGKKKDLPESIRDNVFVLDKGSSYFQLRYLVDAVCHGGCLENSIISVLPLSIEKSFEVSNDIFNIERIVYVLTKEFIYFLDFNTLERVRVGLAEMLTNAIEHGNLAISGEQKLEATENGTYYDLVDERLNDERYKDKKVTFCYYIDAEQVKISIEDKGKGFKIDEIPDPTDPEGLFKLHGRGILITRMYFDSVSYNSVGNRVELVKRF
jgi:anti-sigma regulatory factor (Ser/Thr protein kinase)